MVRKHAPNRTPTPSKRRQCIRLRRQRRWGADQIGHEVGLAASTVQNILHAVGMGRLDSGDRATAEPVVRYQRDRPGELIHVDIEKIAAIPDGGGSRTDGRANTTRQGGGYCYIHSALDDRTRIVYSETPDRRNQGEKGPARRVQRRRRGPPASAPMLGAMLGAILGAMLLIAPNALGASTPCSLDAVFPRRRVPSTPCSLDAVFRRPGSPWQKRLDP